MAGTICLAGPAFSLSGENYFAANAISFQVVLDDPGNAGTVIAYEWFLDGILCPGMISADFTGNAVCGSHSLGVRLLTAAGWSAVRSASFFTCKVPGQTVLTGPDSLNEGTTAVFQVIENFSDGSTTDLSSGYTFSSTAGGSFNGNVFTAGQDDSSYTDKQVTISASKDGVVVYSKQVTIKNTTPIPLTALYIDGPDSIHEGGQGNFEVIAKYADGSQKDVTNDYVFKCPAGTFVGPTLLIPKNNLPGDNRQVTVTAYKNNVGQLNKQIAIIDTTAVAGVLVIDFYGEKDIDILAFLDNAGVANSNTAAYTGVNYVPAGSAAASALILASDVINQTTLHWRFELNIAQLIAGYPAINDFVFRIKGRGKIGGPIGGQYSIKGFSSQMAMNGGAGSYLPTVVESTNVLPPTNFTVYLTTGANGSHDMAVLPEIARFTYHVDSNTVDVAAAVLHIESLEGAVDPANIYNVFEGLSYPFYLKCVMEDSSVLDLTDKASFSLDLPARGTFNANTLAVSTNTVQNDTVASSVSAAINDLTYSYPVKIVDQTNSSIVINNFDFMTVRYHWNDGDGQDLDILVGFENNGTSYDNQYVGYGHPNPVPVTATPVTDAYLCWGTDNTQVSGYESVLIGMKKFVQENPSAPEIIEVALYAVWFQALSASDTGQFTVELVTFTGGTMSLVDKEFINTGGTQDQSVIRGFKTRIVSQQHMPATSFKVGSVKYNKTTQSATFEVAVLQS